MKRKAVSGIMLMLVLTSILTLAFNIQPSKSNPSTIVVPDEYPTIQQAINHANAGDKIYVKSGTYYEHVVINKTVSLVGENKNTTIVDGSGTGTVIYVDNQRNIRLSGFTIQNGLEGVYILESTNITLSNNSMSGSLYNFVVDSYTRTLPYFIHSIDASNTVNGRPIYYLLNQRGTEISPNAGFVAAINSSGIIARNLTLSKNGYGILFVGTDDSIIQNVDISDTELHGILLISSHRDNISDNRLTRSGWGICLWKFTSDNRVLRNSIVNSSFGILLHGTDCYENYVAQNNVTSNTCGIHTGGATYTNDITRNFVKNNGAGLSMDYNSNNTWRENTVVANGVGIVILGAQGNQVYHNNFVNNNQNHELTESAVVTWNVGYPYGGNYWSDYVGVDLYKGPYQNVTGSDGFGDVPYIMDANNKDHYPLMNLWRLGDLNYDGAINVLDLIIVAKALGTHPNDPKYNPNADINSDGEIDVLDLIWVAKYLGT